MLLFKNKNFHREKLMKAIAQQLPGDEELRQELNSLLTLGQREEVSRALDDAQAALSKATRSDITGIKLMEVGRCPKCQSRIEDLLYTTVCASCGWFRRVVPESGRCIVHLDSGDKVLCDRAFDVQGSQVLCVTDGVVVSQVSRRFLRRIDYVWEGDELAKAKETVKKKKEGICSWCDKSLAQTEGEAVETFVAFGALQDHYLFCSTKCRESFARQYPSRVHRNCYETDCNDCDKCIKRYDTKHFSREL